MIKTVYNQTNFANLVKVVAIMPCYDKKLEAVRPDLEENIKEVDTVLATHEV